MARIKIPDGDIPESHRMLQVNPAFGHAIASYSMAIYEKSPLDIRVREAVRMRIAHFNQCMICLGYRFPELAESGIDETFYDAVNDWQTSNVFNDTEKLALEYTERFIEDHLTIDDLFFHRLHEHFSNEEVFALTATIAGLLANGRIMQVLQIEQSCSLHFDESGKLII